MDIRRTDTPAIVTIHMDRNLLILLIQAIRQRLALMKNILNLRMEGPGKHSTCCS
jgi:hypothetical protein